MKKFLKTVAGIGALAAFAGGVYYAYKKYREENIEDFDDEEEFDLFDSDGKGRSYVTLDMEDEAAEATEDEKTEDSPESEN